MKELIQNLHAAAWFFTTGAWWMVGAAFYESGLPAPGWLLPDAAVSVVLSLLGIFWILDGEKKTRKEKRTFAARRKEARRLGMVQLTADGTIQYIRKEERQ